MSDIENLMKEFMADHKEVFDEAKWCLIMAACNDVDCPEDLRIEKDMTCSDLYKRAIDMYFCHGGFRFDKVMYINA